MDPDNATITEEFAPMTAKPLVSLVIPAFNEAAGAATESTRAGRLHAVTGNINSNGK